MPPKDSIRLDSGTIYFNTPEGLKPLGGVQSVEITEEPPELDIYGDKPAILVPQSGEITGTITLTAEASEALSTLAAKVEAAYSLFNQILKNIKEMCDVYPYRRSKHLAAHGSPRVCKKNAKRIARYYKKLKRS